MAGLVAGWTVPRRRWIIVPLLVLGLEIAFNFAAAVWVTILQAYPNQEGLLEGVGGGVVLGVVLGGFCGAQMRPAPRLATMLLAAAALLAIPVASAWRARGDLVAMRESVLPGVEKLLRTDVLVKTGPVRWTGVRRMLSDDGVLYWRAYGGMSSQRMTLCLEVRNPRHRTRADDDLQGLSLDSLELQLTQPESIAHDQKRSIRSMGVRPELADRFVIQRDFPGDVMYSNVATYHGIEYKLMWNTAVVYGLRALPDVPHPAMIYCHGTYSASAA